MSTYRQWWDYCSELPEGSELPSFKAFCAAWPFPVGTSSAQQAQEGTSQAQGDDNGGGLAVWVGSHPSRPQSGPGDFE